MSHVRIGEGIISGPGYPADVDRLRGEATGGNTLQCDDHRKLYGRSGKLCASSDHRKLYGRRNHSREIRKREFLRRQCESGGQSGPGETRLSATPAQRSAEILSISGSHRNAFQKHGVPDGRRDQRE